ncbi:MAG: 2-oxopent-4-enoate hydratase [Stygiobacter sp. RIFOXYC12_FULL_38_8]|nr:MAG: 2-oxopent-4-enoate hydratase [Stygiobacter sp. GWC2_38_9]OGU85588.1 MAG: 2-oxopent-4-enoate hydratase [Stygiobacter sp. RIFOXYA12_FULL_38_9]OGV07078.1 MAG: 2-oxopent-4-enoate hydratase [Stygiobacter sp. RIFOXYB2_FULL_37_11]OGV11016.1 MAG: 2-oxopent-4-enoate hydratase [Stygiobacter sp. RIFOXYA2_FULL_38_8]OGV12406.1 MAG: 2-oxopent-4-enoate hydratase [Stygiobacter sp. RIFOXYC2_FULL_38_25]OGV25273.1 MAG: 2-oxopent-4-enoate hydratase [Stygiobacter sp. RIFOXYC12_FULL_38_8]OGV83042.1 MAG: 2-
MKYLKFKNSDEKVPIGKLVCVGRNYAAHAKELGGEASTEFPIIFLKPASNVIFSGESVIHPPYSENLHHEVELVLYIGEDIKNGTDEQAEKAIHGYTVGLDMTLRDLQFKFKEKGDPWTLAKCFDTAAVLGDVVLKKDYQLRGDENISLSVNDTVKQNTSISNMIFNAAQCVKHISSRMTLEKGDLIFTGTPEGVGRVVPGDKLFGEIENIGTIVTQISK